MGPIKRLSGGDRIRAERKGEPSFQFRNRAKLLFGANRPPVLGEKSDAVKRRLLPIRLPYRFTDDPDDGNPDKVDRSELVEELTTDDELSGLLNKALEGIERLRANGDFSLPETEDERMERYQSFSDPIKMFSERCVANVDEAGVTKDAVYETYVSFCEVEDHDAMTRNAFFRELNRTGFTMEKKRPSVDGDRVFALMGADLTERGEGLCPDRLVDQCAAVTAHEFGTKQGGGTKTPTKLGSVDWTDDAPNPDAVTVEAIDADAHPQSDKKAFEATVRDGSNEEVGVVAWDSNPPGSGHLVHGECYLIERPMCGRDHQGRKQITLEGRSSVSTIQRGVGHIGNTDSGENDTLGDIRDSSTDVESIAGDDDVPQGDVRDTILSETIDPVGRDMLTDFLVEDCGLDRERVDHRIDTMLTDGDLHVNTDGDIEQR